VCDIEKLEDLKKLAMALVNSKKKFDKLSLKCGAMSMASHTMKKMTTAK
jgi:hypothetical protein